MASASSGIAALNLPGGRTAHSSFGLPFNCDQYSTSTIKKEQDRVELMRQASLFIWDEAPMMSRWTIETFDRALRDFTNNEDTPFGGKCVVFGGDF